MEELIILPCALKHGVTQESIEFAWGNCRQAS